MKLNKKGFTLVELLAVIVVLAIIALIGYTVVGDTINNAQYAADARSLESYISSIESTCMEKKVLSPTLTSPSLSDVITAVNASYKGTKPAATTNIKYDTSKDCKVASTASGVYVNYTKSKCTYNATTGAAVCEKLS